ncbi:MAG TPA: protein kinase, partial [Gemmataceae bacterium]|nr:protein kinase [Gemmataceae bacterium]
MPVKVQCPNPACARTFTVDDSLIGRNGRCDACGQKFAIQAPPPGGAKPPPPPAGEPGRVGRFQVRQRLGSGAFGTVYRAYDPQLDREVALKVPRAGLLDSPNRVERFLREARAAAQLRHPNIVPVYDAGQDGGRHYIAAAFIAGQALSAAVEENGIDCRRAATVVRALADAVGYAHTLGIVHRDIKPANVMLDEEDRPHLTDFGLAARAEEAEKLTQEGSVLGTPAYMAPEQAGGQQGEPRPASDQYSLGVLLYELLTGKTPFAGPTQVVLYNVLNSDPPPPRSLRPDIPLDLETICLKAMAKDPEDRYADCREFADDLGRWLDGEFVRARPPGHRERFRKWRGRHPRLAAALVSAAVLLLVATVGAGLYAVKARADADEARGDVSREMQQTDAERRHAEEERQRTADEKRRAEEARARAEAEKLAGDQVRYAKLIAQAQQDHADNKIDHALARLDATRWDLRGWEHDYLRRLVAGSRLTLRGHDGPVTAVAYSADGKRVVSGGADRTVRLWDAMNGDLLLTVKGLAGEVRSVAFSPDGKRV